MLTKFAVTNFRGFENRIEWDLSKPRNYEFNPYAVKDGIVKNGIIYGPNGSGKTNFGMAIFDIINHTTQKKKIPEYYLNFSHAAHEDEPTKFEYTFQLGEDKIEYSYAKDSKARILNEKLMIGTKEIFNRTKEKLTLDKSIPVPQNLTQRFVFGANNYSFLFFLFGAIPFDKNHAILKLQNFVNSMLWFRHLESREFMGLENQVEILAAYINKNNLLGEFANFLKASSEQSFEFANPSPDENRIFCKSGTKLKDFNKICSTGTHALTLLYYWYKHLENASFVFIDEFDAFYHFELSFNICKLLFEKTNCQLFLSSHNTYLMTNDLLRPDCNFLLKNGEIKPLCDCTEKELRVGHNIENLYRGRTFEQ